jgi:hypothetical protein
MKRKTVNKTIEIINFDLYFFMNFVNETYFLKRINVKEKRKMLLVLIVFFVRPQFKNL